MKKSHLAINNSSRVYPKTWPFPSGQYAIEQRTYQRPLPPDIEIEPINTNGREAMRNRSLRGIKITGNWWDIQPDGRKGKRCEITGPGGVTGIHDVKECAKICGSNFFDEDTMKFFKSRIGDTAYLDGSGGALFVTSEKNLDNPRKYTVRHYDYNKCSIKTVGEFQSYSSMRQAEQVAKKLASGRRRVK